MRDFKKIINTKRLIENYNSLLEKAGGVRTVPVVKADAYGHSVKIVVKALTDAGINYFAVAYSGEALRLKRQFPTVQILVMGVPEKKHINKLITLGIELTVSHWDTLEQIIADAKKLNLRPKIHLKIDTGMNRLGFRYDMCEQISERLSKLTEVEFEGIMSHFACSDTPEHPLNRIQLKRFKQCLQLFKKNKVTFKYRHIANSGGILNLPDSHFNMVRTGISLYGYAPGPETKLHGNIKPVMEVCGKVSQVKRVKKGEPVSYGATEKIPENGLLAVIPVGFGDGYSRNLSNGVGKVMINGRLYPICGRICMDQFMVFSHENDINAGDKAYLLSTEHQPHVSADDMAGATGTISYEILCGFLPRLPIKMQG